MKFKTKKSSNTGKKFAKMKVNADAAHEAIVSLSKELGFSSWRRGYWSCFGGASSVSFDEAPDNKIWKKRDDGYYPKKNSKEGKKLAEKFENLPTVTAEELNGCVGYDGAPFKSIGYNSNNDEYFGFAVGDDWGFTPPKDCVEITTTEYNRLFKD